MEFQGKVAVVTGAGRGIGRAIALAFAHGGADVALTGRDRAALAEAAAAVEALGGKSLGVPADLTTEDGAVALAQAVTDRFGRADIVVTAAGARDHADRTVAEMDPTYFDRIVRDNVLSTVLPVRALLPGMIARRSGKVVTISGVFGIRGRARHSAGASAKWAIEGFVRSLALEVGASNINVNAVCPGYVEGPRSIESMVKIAAGRGITPEEVRAELVGETVLRRLSTASDVADAVLFLASERARNITGQDLVVDAGWTL